jgi:predicted dehydrogenase
MRVVVIGLGRMGQRHLDVIRACGWDIAGVCDLDAETLADTATRHNLPDTALYQDAENLFRDTRPDCAVVATTAPSHCRYTCQAAESGVRRILCEKPMAVSLAECDRMLAACQRHGAALAVNHQMRFMPQYAVPKRLAASPELGGVRSVTVVCGNFGLAMNGTHYFEMFRYLTDEAPTSATAWLSTDHVPNPRGAQFDDRAGAVRLTTASGHRFFLDADADQGQGLKTLYGCRLGQILVDEYSGHVTVTQRAAEDRSLPTTRFFTQPVEVHHEVGPFELIEPTTRVMQALADGTGYPTGDDARLAIAALVAAHVSHETGQAPITIGPGLPLDRRFDWA